MSNDALTLVTQFQTIASQLSDAADAYNARLKLEANNLTAGDVYARLQEEQRLRSIANQLYFEATDLVVAHGACSESDLEDAITQATAKLTSLQDFAKALDLIADLVTLAGAILATKPGPILAALAEVYKDVRAS